MGLCFVNDLLLFRQAHLLVEHALLLEAVLLLLVNTLLNRLIVAFSPLHLVTLRAQTLLLRVTTYLVKNPMRKQPDASQACTVCGRHTAWPFLDCFASPTRTAS